MDRQLASIRLGGAASVMLVAAIFCHFYSQTSYINLKNYYGYRTFREQVPPACEIMLHGAPYLILVSVLLVAAGAIAIARTHERIVHVIVEIGWVAAIVVICLTVWLWAIPYSPIITPLH